MEQFVKSLFDRLDGNPEAQTMLIGIMDGAINEMHNNGVFSRLPADLQEKIHSDDPEERITVKTSVAKGIASQSFIPSSNPIVLKNGDVAHMITVKYDPSFKNSIALCIQGGLEGLYLSGAYKRCADEIMQYYIQTDVKGEDYNDFRKIALDLEGLYDNFQLNFFPISFGQAASGKSNSPAKKSDATGETKEKKGFFGKLFGKK